jgi:ASC-1-like (ASCH) protein
MAIYEAGRESSILDDILVGDKRIECRLDRSKFAKYELGDRIRLRRDIYRNGEVIVEVPNQAEVEVTRVQAFPSFRAMFEQIGYELAIPRAVSIDEALAKCREFYTEAEEKEHGVRAIHFKLIWPTI